MESQRARRFHWKNVLFIKPQRKSLSKILIRKFKGFLFISCSGKYWGSVHDQESEPLIHFIFYSLCWVWAYYPLILWIHKIEKYFSTNERDHKPNPFFIKLIRNDQNAINPQFRTINSTMEYSLSLTHKISKMAIYK